MDLKSLRCFIAVAEKLNFSRAAESLYLSQPALSLRINALEEELGVPLFRRTHQKVYLTSAGSALLPEAQELISRFEALPQIARNGAHYLDSASGTITVYLDSTLPETMMESLTEKFAEFYETYPEVQVAIDAVDFNQYETSLLSRKADLCFIGFKESELQRINPLFNYIPLSREPMVLAFAGEKELPLEELLERRELLLLEGEDRWNMVLLNDLDARKLHPRIRTIRGGPSLCVNLMRADTLTCMPISFFETLKIPSLSYRELGIPESHVISSLVWDKLNFNPALQLLINCFDAKEL